MVEFPREEDMEEAIKTADSRFGELADTVEEFSGKVEMYDDLVALHKDGEVSARCVENYIRDRGGEEGGLVDAWRRAEEAAEKLRNIEAEEYDPAPVASPVTPETPVSPPSPVSGTTSTSFDRDRAGKRLWDVFYDSLDVMTGHEEYAREAFDTSPAKYRMEEDQE